MTDHGKMPTIPARIDGRWYTSLETHEIRGISGAPLARLTLTPLIKTHEVFRRSEDVFQTLQALPARRILRSLRDTGNLLRRPVWEFGSFSRAQYCALVAASTGLPLSAMAEEVEEIADMFGHLEDITAPQLPGPLESALDAHQYVAAGQTVGYYPAGKNVLIVLPGNIPTICVYWLMPLAQKIPVVLLPPFNDPFTHFVLFQAIEAVDPILAACIQFAPAAPAVVSSMLQRVDLLVLPESARKEVPGSSSIHSRTHVIHFGRTKLLIAGSWDAQAVGVAFRRMMWKWGRTCTGLTAVIVEQGPREFCERLATTIACEGALATTRCPDQAPLFATEHARRIDQTIESFVQAGEVEDVTNQITCSPRLQVHDGVAMLRPTVLLVKKRGSKAFGLELPFPFVSVIQAADRAEMIERAKHTLILSVIGGDDELVRRLCLERSILKIFGGSQLERGYKYSDPHEGYMADFLYQKKAVSLC
jgi:thienamycin biosynthesis protein ThnO